MACQLKKKKKFIMFSFYLLLTNKEKKNKLLNRYENFENRFIK